MAAQLSFTGNMPNGAKSNNREGGNEDWKRKGLVEWTGCGQVVHEGVGGGDKKRRIRFQRKWGFSRLNDGGHSGGEGQRSPP